jgi:hypothetical protein
LAHIRGGNGGALGEVIGLVEAEGGELEAWRCPVSYVFWDEQKRAEVRFLARQIYTKDDEDSQKCQLIASE